MEFTFAACGLKRGSPRPYAAENMSYMLYDGVQETRLGGVLIQAMRSSYSVGRQTFWAMTKPRADENFPYGARLSSWPACRMRWHYLTPCHGRGARLFELGGGGPTLRDRMSRPIG